MYKALNRDLIQTITDLPTHPHLTHPRTGFPLVALGFRRNGTPIWPVMGGDGTDGGGGDGGAGGAGGAGGTGGAGDGKPTTFDQAAVDKIVADRLARERAKFADYDQVKQKAGEYDKLAEANRTEQEKAIAAAKTEAGAAARAEVLGQVAGQLVAAQIRAEVAGRVPAEQLTVLLDNLNHAGFLNADHQVDADKVKAYVAGIVPTKRPPNLDQGNRNGSGGGGTPTVASGRDLWAERHPAKKTS
jgi:hypothetical protein